MLELGTEPCPEAVVNRERAGCNTADCKTKTNKQISGSFLCGNETFHQKKMRLMETDLL